MRRGITLLFFVLAFAICRSENMDTLRSEIKADTLSVHKKDKNIITKIIDYFSETNKVKPNKRYDFSILGGPHYSSETKFGLGVMAAGLYKRNLNDTITPMSMVGLYGDFSTTGFYLVGIKGYHLFPLEKYRLNYKLYFYSQPNYFWGMGYDRNSNDDNEMSYRRKQFKIDADFTIRVAENVYIGPTGQFCIISGSHIEDGGDWLWEEQKLNITSSAVGFVMSYDTRDNIANAFSGVNLELHQRFYPAFIGNKYAFSSTELTGNYYCQVWKGGVIATQLHGLFTYGNTPWTMMPSITSSNGLRGYYDGRYNDKCEIDATVELRQHIWHRNGLVAWVGAGNVFPKFSALRLRNTLPNYGVGYRWEFKTRINVRLDVGFGKGEKGIVFNVNEAF